MKIYEIFDEENSRTVGVLLYYEYDKSVIIELEDDLDQWNAPLLFTALVNRGVYTVPKETSLTWVKERVIPSDRQNIGAILSNHRLKQYDEMTFLEISKGRCSQDSLCIRKIDELPKYVLKRQAHNLVELLLLNDYTVLGFFENGKIKKIDLKKITDVKDIEKVIKFEQVYNTGKVGTGGYSACFNDVIDIPSRYLYNVGIVVPLTLDDFRMFVMKNVLDTTQVSRKLSCSRQNIAYMVNRGQLSPIRTEVNGNLFLKGEVDKYMRED